ncbi:hypothetical protein ILYODFUR_014802 [Ilyodon furcidens]|uniref:Uncharacterized protein n=1 Tax=Ilyodon furcidens TaxID=33524 RepID=A0ABV0TYE9_9TELE
MKAQSPNTLNESHVHFHSETHTTTSPKCIIFSATISITPQGIFTDLFHHIEMSFDGVIHLQFLFTSYKVQKRTTLQNITCEMFCHSSRTTRHLSIKKKASITTF